MKLNLPVDVVRSVDSLFTSYSYTGCSHAEHMAKQLFLFMRMNLQVLLMNDTTSKSHKIRSHEWSSTRLAVYEPMKELTYYSEIKKPSKKSKQPVIRLNQCCSVIPA